MGSTKFCVDIIQCFTLNTTIYSSNSPFFFFSPLKLRSKNKAQTSKRKREKFCDISLDKLNCIVVVLSMHYF